ncbi:hypothetical protein Agub_g9177, partial [Astrephomene gubernaculifera]
MSNTSACTQHDAKMQSSVHCSAHNSCPNCASRDAHSKSATLRYAAVSISCFATFLITWMLLTGPMPRDPPSTFHVPTQIEYCQAYLGGDLHLDPLPPSFPPDTTTSTTTTSSSSTPHSTTGGLSLILTADPGDFSGTPEAQHIISNLRHMRQVARTRSVCGGLYLGRLMGQQALVVTTGIGPTAAGLCLQELLTSCGAAVREVLYFGTSGWSPQLGGVLNPPHCGQANDNGKIVRVGDVCVSPVSVNWVCKKASWGQQAAGYPNQCFRPGEAAGPEAAALYGDCIFGPDNLDANLALSDALLSAAASPAARSSTPRRSPLVLATERRYWELMAQGTGATYPAVEGGVAPALWDYSQCAEVDGQFFFTGAPWEIKARDYAAEAISAALGFGSRGNSNSNNSSSRGTTAGSRGQQQQQLGADQVIAVSAMEGVGVSEALLKYHRLDSTPRRIPYTSVRTASNWVHPPLGKVGEGDVWGIFAELPEDYVNGYKYAIATGSATILSLFQQRCRGRGEEQGRSGVGPAGGEGGQGRQGQQEEGLRQQQEQQVQQQQRQQRRRSLLSGL